MRCLLAFHAVFVSGEPSVHFAQTLRFSRFIALPHPRFEFKAFWDQNHALAEVWRTCVLLTSVLSTGSALGELGSQSLHYYNTFRMHISETIICINSKSKLCTPIGDFELLVAVM